MLNKKTNLGYSLIEVLVALVILSMIFISTWEWFSAATLTSKKLAQQFSLNYVISQFFVEIKKVDLAAKDSGVVKIDNYRFVWVSSTEKRSDEQSYRKQIFWVSALSKLIVTIELEGRTIFEFETYIYHNWLDKSYKTE